MENTVIPLLFLWGMSRNIPDTGLKFLSVPSPAMQSESDL